MSSCRALRSLLIRANPGTVELCAILVVADLNILADPVLKRLVILADHRRWYGVQRKITVRALARASYI